jgi:flagellar motor switch protein FliM
MTAGSTDNLNPTVASSLLAAVGSTQAENDEVGEVLPFDWRHPRYFDAEQRNRIAAMMTQAAAVLSARFTHFYNQSFDVSVTSVSEHFAGDWQGQIAAQEGFCMTFGPNPNQTVGFLMVGAPTAFHWVTLLLGDQDSQTGEERALSTLEQSLLSDLMTALLEAFLSLLRSQKDMKAVGQIVKGMPAVPFEATQEISAIVFQAKKPDAQTVQEITFVLPCSVLAPLVGKTLTAPPKISAEELSRQIMEHLQEMPITVTAVLGSSWLNFAEALDLNPDDVLLLDKTIDVPVELKINNRPVFWGHAAQSDGQYAVLVTASDDGRDAKSAVPDSTHNIAKPSKKG